MGADRVASLPMYDFPELREAHDEFWGALAARLGAAGLMDVPRALTRGVSLGEVCGDNRLLFAQACEYPIATAFHDRVRVVAHPLYAAAGCDGARYRSAIIVRAEPEDAVTGSSGAVVTSGGGAEPCGRVAADGARARHTAKGRNCWDIAATDADAQSGYRKQIAATHADEGGVAGGGGDARAERHGSNARADADVDSARALAGLRGRRCVVNERDSNSGMNLLRASVAPLAASGERFFGSVVVSGSHLRSVEMVAAGEADVASIDCVSFAHFQQLYPSLASLVRVLDWTVSTPSLPYISAGTTSDATVQALRAALAEVFADSSLTSVRDRLLLRGVDLNPAPGFGEVLALERQAVEGGYPVLR